MKRLDVKPQPYVKELCCDRCGREAELDNDDHEFAEFMSIDRNAGFGSIFGDGNKVQVDLCQHCFKELLGPWLHIKDRIEGFDLAKHGGEFPNYPPAV